MNSIKIGIAGSGWGFWAAVKSITKNFNHIALLNTLEPLEVRSFINQNVDIDLNTIDNITDFNCDLIICAGYKPIISKDFLLSNRVINIHYSLLPKYRGLHSTVWAILNSEAFLGYTVHVMNEFIDDGDIIFQHKIENIATKSSTDYMHYFNNHVEEHLGLVVEDYLNGKLTPYPQDKLKASWVGKRSFEDCRINFNLRSQEIANLFRALVPPYPTPFFEYNGKNYFPKKVRFHSSTIKTHIGRILNIDNEGIWVKIIDGYVIFNEIYTDTGKLTPIGSFKIGYYLNIGK